jgi:hypothetical protein
VPGPADGRHGFYWHGAAAGGYDSVDRLRQYQRGVLAEGGGSVVAAISLPNTDQSRSYDLDGLGNWRRTAYTPVGDDEVLEIRQHNGLNQITRREIDDEKTTFAYDGVSGASNGNLVDDGQRLYTWDAFNRLLEVRRKSDSALVGQYAYDAAGRGPGPRVRRGA